MELKPNYERDFETYLINLGLKRVTYQKLLLYFKHFKEMYGGFITQKVIDSFLTTKTSSNHKSMVRHLLDFINRDETLSNEERLEMSRMVILKKVGRAEVKPLQVLTKIEVQKVIDNCKLPSDFQTTRFKLMVGWQFSGGLRVNELCSLRWEHLNYQGREKFFQDGRDKLKYQKLFITPDIAKGNKGRPFWISTNVYLAYFDFLKHWKEINPVVANRIMNNQRNIWGKNKTKYSKDFKQQVFSVLGFKLPDNKSTHILRHSRATGLILEGMKLEEVRDFMGHSSVAVTEKYLHIAEDLVSKGLEKLGGEKT